eukprot:12222065-Karenia_brevis.AAC.1
MESWKEQHKKLMGRIRSILLSLEERLGREVDAKERIVALIQAYAAYLYNRLHRGDDGKGPYERVKGEKPSVLGIEFGEKVLYMRHMGSKVGENKVKMGV